MAAHATTPPPAYFLSIRLENVRSFGEKQRIDFARTNGRPAQWTIILGDNGTGKTTILKALAATAPTLDNGSKIDRYVSAFVNGGYNHWLPWRGDGSEEAAFTLLTEGNCKLSEKNEVGSEDKFVFSFSVPPFRPGKFHFLSYAGTTAKSTPFAPSLICYGYGAGRTTGNSTLSETPEAADTCASLFDDRADLLNPEEWFLQMEYSSLKQDRQAAQALEQVRQVLLQVLPDVSDLRISSKGHQQYLELQTPYGWVRLRDMSLGYQTLVVWLTDFASKLFLRYPNSPNPLAEPAIVLIDEIDLHLHPSWQRRLLGFLGDIFPNTQFIATAHSPLVVQAAGDEQANVVLLKREGDQTVVYQGHDLPDVRHWRVEQIMSSELFDTPLLSPQTEADLTRRNELLLKKRPTKAEKAELARLEATVAAQPAGTTVAEQRADSLLARLSRNLQLDDDL